MPARPSRAAVLPPGSSTSSSCGSDSNWDCDETVRITAPPSLESYAICAHQSYSIDPREDLEIHYFLTDRAWSQDRLEQVKLLPTLRNTRGVYSTCKLLYGDRGEPIVSVRLRNCSKEKRGNVKAGKVIALILQESDKFLQAAAPAPVKTASSLLFRGHRLPKFNAVVGPLTEVNEVIGRNYPIWIRDVSFRLKDSGAALDTIVLEDAVIKYREDILVSAIKTSSYDGTRFEAGYMLKDVVIGVHQNVYSRIEQAVNTSARRLAENDITVDKLEVEGGYCWFWASVPAKVPATIGARAQPLDSLAHWMKEHRGNVKGSASVTARLKAVLPQGSNQKPNWRLAFTLKHVAVESYQVNNAAYDRASSEGLTAGLRGMNLGGEYELIEDLERLELGSSRR